MEKAPPDVAVKTRAELTELEDQSSKVQTSFAGLS